MNLAHGIVPKGIIALKVDLEIPFFNGFKNAFVSVRSVLLNIGFPNAPLFRRLTSAREDLKNNYTFPQNLSNGGQNLELSSHPDEKAFQPGRIFMGPVRFPPLSKIQRPGEEVPSRTFAANISFSQECNFQADIIISKFPLS
jgi:hypothetical protein